MKHIVVIGSFCAGILGGPVVMAQDTGTVDVLHVDTKVHNDGRSMGRFMQANPPHGDGVISVTTDSPEYCAQLVASVDSIIIAPHGVPVGAMEDGRRLRENGAKLCRNGHLRAGIERLRRALVLLEHSQDHS